MCAQCQEEHLVLAHLVDCQCSLDCLLDSEEGMGSIDTYNDICRFECVWVYVLEEGE